MIDAKFFNNSRLGNSSAYFLCLVSQFSIKRLIVLWSRLRNLPKAVFERPALSTPILQIIPRANVIFRDLSFDGISSFLIFNASQTESIISMIVNNRGHACDPAIQNNRGHACDPAIQNSSDL